VGPARVKAAPADAASLSSLSSATPTGVPLPTQASVPVPARLRDCAECPELLQLPAGEFLMSSSADDYEHDLRSGETPALRVRIRQAFALSSREVTNKQFRAFLAATRQQPKYSCATQGVDDEPVRCVTSQDAERYLLWLSARSGRRYRLPSESELEFALRAGTDTARFWSGRDSHEGISISRACDFCNVKDVTGRAIASPGSWARCTDGFLGLAPVAQFSANL